MIEVALRRRGPDSLPDSTFLVVFLLAIDTSLSLLVSVLFGGVALFDLVRLAAHAALICAFVYAVLTFFKLERRFRQTVSAVFGASIVIGLAFFFVGIIGMAMGFELSEPPFIWVYRAFFVWFVFIVGSVLARSLSQPFFVGLMFAILLVVTMESLGSLLSPTADIVPVEVS